MASDEEIKVTGEFMSDPNMCRFQVNRPVLPDAAVVFNKGDETYSSPLADQLFAIDGITRIKIADDQITLSKNIAAPWPELAKFILPAIREPLLSTQPAVSAAAIEAAQLTPQADMAEAIEALLEQHINPALASHGGFVTLVKVDNKDVYIEMGGGCQGCAASQMTMKNGVETAIREICPDVGEIIDVTDHAAGTNPYYS